MSKHGESTDQVKEDEKEGAILQLRRFRQKLFRDMDEIIDGLWIGNLRNALKLENTKIGAIVSILDSRNQCAFLNSRIPRIIIDVADSPEQDVIKHFPNTNLFIHSHRLHGKAVLVHCMVGVSRSVCFVVAYLMAAVPSLDYATALAFVKRKRECAHPNFGFRMQLIKYDQTIKSERERLRKSFDHATERFTVIQIQDISNTNSAHLLDSPDAN